MAYPSVFLNELPKQESLVNLIGSVNGNQLRMYYSNNNNDFKEKIDNLNLLFYIETEKILKRQRGVNINGDCQSQDTLLILLFTQINLYIAEIERLNKVINEYDGTMLLMKKEEKEQKEMKRNEIATKDQIISKLRGSVALLEGSLLDHLRKRIHSEGSDLYDYSRLKPMVSDTVGNYAIEAFTFSLNTTAGVGGVSKWKMQAGRNINSDSIMLNSSLGMNSTSKHNTTIKKVIPIPLTMSLSSNIAKSVNLNSRQYSIEDSNKGIETSFGNSYHFFRKTNDNHKKKSGMRIIKNIKENRQKMKVENVELSSSDREHHDKIIMNNNDSSYYANSFPSLFKTQRIPTKKLVTNENNRYIDVNL